MKKYIDSFMNYRFLLSELVKKGIRLKYRRSYLGVLWSLLEPLLTTKQVHPVQNPPGFSESLFRILFFPKIERMFDFV